MEVENLRIRVLREIEAMSADPSFGRFGAEEVAPRVDEQVRSVALAMFWAYDNGYVAGINAWQGPIVTGLTPEGRRLLNDADDSATLSDFVAPKR